MALEELDKTLRLQLHGDILSLSRKLDKVAGWQFAWDSIVATSALSISETSISQKNEQLRVKGKAEILGARSTEVIFLFEEDDQGISVSLTVNFPTTIGLSLAGGGLAADSLGFTIFAPGSGKPLSGNIRCTLKTGPLRFPLVVYLPSDPRGWIIQGAFSKVTLPDPAELFTFFGLGTLLQVLPASIDSLDASLYVADLMIKYNVQQNIVDQMCVRLGSDQEWPIILKSLVVSQPSILFSVIQPFAVSERVVFVTIDGAIVTGEISLPVQLSNYGNTEWGIRLTTDYFALPSLNEIKTLAGDPELFEFLPDAVADLQGVVLTRFEIGFDTVDHNLTSMSLGLILEDTWSLPGLGDMGIRNININLNKEAGTQREKKVFSFIEGSLILWGKAVHVSAQLTENITLTGRVSQVDFSQLVESFIGLIDLPADLPDFSFADVDLALTPESGAFSFNGHSTANDWVIPLGIGTLNIADLVLQMERRTAGDEHETGKTSCRVSGQGRLVLEIDGFLAEFTGTVEFEVSSKRIGFTFYARGPTGNQLTLPIPAGVPGITPEVIFIFDKLEFDHTPDGWQVKADASTRFSGMPSFLAAEIPGTHLSIVPLRPRVWSLTIGRGEVAFSIDRLWEGEPPSIPLPTIKFKNKEVSLGVLCLDVRNWSIRFGRHTPSGSKVALQATIMVAVSDQINRIFGVAEDGKTPWLQFFKSFPPGLTDPFSAATGIQLSISGNGITGQLQGSPINAMQPDDSGLYHISLGPNGLFGRVSTSLPEFRYDGLGWAAGGEFHIEEPLKLPLTVVKTGLVQAGLGLIAKVLPDAVPLDQFSLVEDNRLFFEPWLKKLEKGATSLHIPEEVVTILNQLADLGDSVLQRTPGKLNDYLSFSMPADLRYAIEVAGNGGIRMDVTTRTESGANSQPIRLLLPFAGPPWGIPELLGIELTSLSFGEILGGSLFLLEFEGVVDRFDLVTILASQLNGGYLADGKTSCKEYRNFYTVEKLLAVLPAGAPVPVPLFYSELGISYFGWEMLRYETRWSFPQPDNGLFSLIGLFSQLLPYFSEAEYKLDPAIPPKGFALPFTIGPNYIELPPYLGGKQIGSKHGFPQWNGWTSLANLLNGLKTGDPQDFVSALPLEARIGEVRVTFGPLASEVGTAITTPHEFLTTIMQGEISTEAGKKFIKRIGKMGSGPDKQISALLPKPEDGKQNENGLIVLLIGSFEIENIISLQAAFGLAAVEKKGFGTGVQFSGVFGNALRIEIQGNVTVTPSSLSIGGGTGIWWNNSPLTGVGLTTRVNDTGFYTRLTLQLTPKCSLTGEWVITGSSMTIGGDISWDYGGDRPLISGGTITFSKKGMKLDTTEVRDASLYGIKIKALTATFPAESGKAMTATAELEIPNEFSSALRKEVEDAARYVSGELNKTRQLAFQQLDALKGYELSVNGVKFLLTKTCNSIVDTINSRVNALSTKWQYRQKIGFVWMTIWTVNLQEEAKKDTAPYREKLKQFAEHFQESSKVTLAKDVADLVSWATKHKQHTVKRYGIEITKLEILSRSTISQLNGFEQNIGAWVSCLPEQDTGLVIGDAAINYAKGTVNAALNEIAESLEEHRENIPTITGISIDTQLASLSSTKVNVQIMITRGSNSKSYPATFSFDNPVEGARSLFELLKSDLDITL